MRFEYKQVFLIGFGLLICLFLLAHFSSLKSLSTSVIDASEEVVRNGFKNTDDPAKDLEEGLDSNNDLAKSMESGLDLKATYLPSFIRNPKFYERIVQRIEDNGGEELSTAFVFENAALLELSIPALSKVATILAEIDYPIDNFVIIEERKDLAQNFAWLNAGADTPFGRLEPGVPSSEELVSSTSMTDSILRDLKINIFSPLLKFYYPKSVVSILLVSDNLDDKDLESLAKTIGDMENYFLFAPIELAEGIQAEIADSQNQYTANLIESLDYKSLEEANMKGQAAAKLVLKVLNNEYFDELEKETLEEAERKLHILAFGDMMLGRYVRTLMDRAGDKKYVFENIEGHDAAFFKGADIVHGNLEGPIKGEGKSGGTSMNFAFNVDIAPFLKEKGFDLMSISNNHSLDSGWDGRDTTIAALDSADLGWCGHPTEPDPESVYYGSVGIQANKLSYAFLCLHDVSSKLDRQKAIELIAKLDTEVDLVIISIHWGYEYRHTADQAKQVDLAHGFVDAGADFIIGHHPHVVQNFEIYKDRFIFYSLGNFVFDQYWSTATQEQLGLGISIGKESTEVRLIPMKSELSQSRLMNKEEANKWIEKFISYGNYNEDTVSEIRKLKLSN